ncbi:hypothetical protein WK66_25810 [Burkholderia ubonensis]|nr:hypothetical protein WK66_25810 [Burkholderia ubonensis]
MLLWNDLRGWYAEMHGVDSAEGSKMLYRRLRQSVIGTNSPGEYALFTGTTGVSGNSLAIDFPL